MWKFIVAQIPSSSNAGKGNPALQIKAVYNIAQIQDDRVSFWASCMLYAVSMKVLINDPRQQQGSTVMAAVA